MVVAKKLEDMELPTLAAEQYNKIALLHYVHKSTDPERADEQTALRAMLGHARCLMATGEYNKAGNALRELSLELGQGEVRAEALYLWAELAMNANQKHEARRRLEMVDENEASPATAAMIAAKLALLDMSEAEHPAKVTERLVKALSGLDVEKHAVFINDACERGFGILANKRDVAGMRQIFDFRAG